MISCLPPPPPTHPHHHPTLLYSGAPLFPGTSDIDQLCRQQALLGSIDEGAWPGVRSLPDWGKLVFPSRPPAPLGGALPGADPAALELLAGLLQYNPALRPPAAAALRSRWLTAEPLPAAPATVVAAVRAALAGGHG